MTNRNSRIDLILTRYVWHVFLARNVSLATGINPRIDDFVNKQCVITPEWFTDYVDLQTAIRESKALPDWSHYGQVTPTDHQTSIAMSLGATTPTEVGYVITLIRRTTHFIKETYFLESDTSNYIHYFDDNMHTDITRGAGLMMAAFHRCRTQLNLDTETLIKFLMHEHACVNYVKFETSYILILNNGYISYSPIPLCRAEDQALAEYCRELYIHIAPPAHISRHTVGFKTKG
jgi:hypothetical protein